MKISSLFKPLSFLPALAIMYMIYSFSAQPGDQSSSLSYSVSKKIVEAVDVISQQHWDEWQINEYASQIHGPVRKAAHITEYFLLAIAVSFPLYVYGVRGILLMLLAGGICVVYACLDEYHQSMVAARAPSSRDVMIDSIGIFAGVILTRLIGWSGRMAITGPAYERRQKKQQRELDEREDMLRRREAALRREERRYQDENRSMRRNDRRYRNERYAMRDEERRYRSEPSAVRQNDIRYRSEPAAVREDNIRYRSEPAAVRQNDIRYRSEPAAVREDDIRYRSEPSAVREDDIRYRSEPSAVREDNLRYRSEPSAARQEGPRDHTIVLGSEHEVDDRTRVYRSEEQQKRMEEAYRRQVYERRRVQSQNLQDDSTSDQLSDDLPLSGLFGKKKKRS